MNATRRQEIAAILREGPATLEDLARLAGADAATVRADLEHVRRSLGRGERFVIHPASCARCGFVFADRKRLSTPSRCPSCRSERIDDPSFRIDSTGAAGE